MTDIRGALEEAWLTIYGAPDRSNGFDYWKPELVAKRLRFNQLIQAEAWTDAAMCLVPENHRIVTLTEHVDRGGWYVKLAVHSPHKALPAVEAPTLALALAQACLKARENADG